MEKVKGERISRYRKGPSEYSRKGGNGLGRRLAAQLNPIQPDRYTALLKKLTYTIT